VRIIQRFGRIDRIGSPNERIQLVNFWPNMELEEYINLEQRVSGKMVLLDISATGEENLIEQRVGRLAEVIHRAIPYPVILVFSHDGEVLVSLAHKRFSQAEKGAVVADDFLATGWIALADPSPPQQAFVASLRFADLPQTHFYALYSALADRLVALACADLSGAYRLETALERRGQRRARLTECRALEARIQGLKDKIRKETQFNRQVELNTQIKQLERELRDAVAHL
jgi:hypothetical protein